MRPATAATRHPQPAVRGAPQPRSPAGWSDLGGIECNQWLVTASDRSPDLNARSLKPAISNVIECELLARCQSPYSITISPFKYFHIIKAACATVALRKAYLDICSRSNFPYIDLRNLIASGESFAYLYGSTYAIRFEWLALIVIKVRFKRRSCYVRRRQGSGRRAT